MKYFKGGSEPELALIDELSPINMDSTSVYELSPIPMESPSVDELSQETMNNLSVDELSPESPSVYELSPETMNNLSVDEISPIPMESPSVDELSPETMNNLSEMLESPSNYAKLNGGDVSTSLSSTTSEIFKKFNPLNWFNSTTTTLPEEAKKNDDKPYVATPIVLNNNTEQTSVGTTSAPDTVSIGGGKSIKKTLASIPAVLLYANPFYKHKSRRHRKRGHGTKKRRHHK